MHELETIDRALLHGDVVCRASDPQGQWGTVVDVNLTCGVRFLETMEQRLLSFYIYRYLDQLTLCVYTAT